MRAGRKLQVALAGLPPPSTIAVVASSLRRRRVVEQNTSSRSSCWVCNALIPFATMPSESQRDSKIRRLKETLLFGILFRSAVEDSDSSSESSDSSDDSLLMDMLIATAYTEYQEAISSRDAAAERRRRTAADTRRAFQAELELSEDDFLAKYRMTRASFDKIADAIKDHEVFKTAGSGRRQPPPSHQLLVLLRYLGTPGGGRGATGARETFGIGSGTAELYRQRARSALRSIRRGRLTELPRVAKNRSANAAHVRAAGLRGDRRCVPVPAPVPTRARRLPKFRRPKSHLLSQGSDCLRRSEIDSVLPCWMGRKGAREKYVAGYIVG
jgi:hypothetical protein